MTAMFVNLPVTDLERAKAFYTAIGFSINPLFTDHNAGFPVVQSTSERLEFHARGEKRDVFALQHSLEHNSVSPKQDSSDLFDRLAIV